MKHKGAEYIIHGLFADERSLICHASREEPNNSPRHGVGHDMMHIYSCDAMKNDFLAYTKRTSKSLGAARCKYSGAWLVEQKSKFIRIHLDNYVKEVVTG